MQYSGCVVAILVGALSSVLALPPLLEGRSFEKEIALPLADDVTNYRLPNNTLPEKYTLELTTNVHSGDRKFTGKVEIDLNVVENTEEITIHARQLTGFVASIIRTDLSVQIKQQLSTNYIKETEFLVLSATGLNFPKNSKWKLSIEYSGTLRTDNGGFYISSYQDKNGTVRYLATTQFESTDARHAFPCYDEPSKRADFSIVINHDPSYFAMSNMPVDQSASTSGRTVFQSIQSISTYLVAFIVSDFSHIEGVLDSLPQRVYSRPGTESDQEFALLSGMVMINRLNEYYKVKYPLPKLDMVAIPDFAAGAMENWGLTTYREEYLLYNPHTSTQATQENVANTIAHEYTHQWFGDLVAIKWWTYLWLKESFATLFEFQITNAAYPEWDYYQVFHAGHYLKTLNNDATNKSRPMTYYVEKPNQISQLYDYVSYSKGGAILFMWQNALTDTVFRQGLHNYLENNKYNAADEDDLFKAIQIAAGEENFEVKERVKEMMGSWTRQTNYPVLTVLRNYENGAFNVTQQAYFDDETLSSDKTWYIPINFATQADADFRDTVATHYLLKTPLLDVTETNIQKDHWLLLNKQSTGLYRINYDIENWNLIIKQLLDKPYKIHTRNRAQLINDASAFSASKRLPHSILLNLLTYLPNEDQYAPWYTAYTVLSRFDKFLKGDKNYKNFKAFVGELAGAAFDKLGVNDVPGQPHLQPYTRNIAINLACLAGIEKCLQEMTKKLNDSIEKNIPVEPNLRSVTYCNGLKNATDQTFDTFYNLLMDSNDQAFRRTLITSLGCSESANQIKKFIESSIDMKNKLRTQERYTLLAPVYSSSSVGLEQSIEFLQKNWDAYAKLTSDFSGSNPAESDLIKLSTYVTNNDQLDKVNALLETVKSKISTGVESSVKSNVKNNFDWLEDNGNSITSWVNAYVSDGKSGASVVKTSLVFIFVMVLGNISR